MIKRAPVLIDVPNDYFSEGKFPLANTAAAAANAARALEAARAARDLIVHVRHESKVVDAPFFAPGSHGAEINAIVGNRDSERLVVKNQINAFRDTDLAEILRQHGATDVTVVGAISHMCIDAIARAAADIDLAIVIVHDAVPTRDLTFDSIMCLRRKCMRPSWRRLNLGMRE